jgi:hypothetical protein
MRGDVASSSDETESEDTGADGSKILPEDSSAPAPVGETTEGEEGRDLNFYEEIAFLVSDLADLADPAARDLIKTAFAEDLVETFIIDEKFVDERYRLGGESPQPGRDWLVGYREQYQKHIDYLKRPPTQPMEPIRPRAAARSEPEPASPPQLVETIRNAGQKLGRNDPCWCGSGKKYKKCHLGKDGR